MKRVADHKGIDIDRAFDLGITEFYNWLVYLKAKEDHDLIQLRHARNKE